MYRLFTFNVILSTIWYILILTFLIVTISEILYFNRLFIQTVMIASLTLKLLKKIKYLSKYKVACNPATFFTSEIVIIHSIIIAEFCKFQLCILTVWIAIAINACIITCLILFTTRNHTTIFAFTFAIYILLLCNLYFTCLCIYVPRHCAISFCWYIYIID